MHAHVRVHETKRRMLTLTYNSKHRPSLAFALALASALALVSAVAVVVRSEERPLMLKCSGETL